MDKVRGILMLAVGAFALFRGFVMYGRANAWLAIGLGLVALPWVFSGLTPRRAPTPRCKPEPPPKARCVSNLNGAARFCAEWQRPCAASREESV